MNDNPFLSWLQAQYRLEVGYFHNDPAALTPEERKDFVRWNAYALEDELHEATQEVAWKPWASTLHFNREKYMKELVDVMFFLGNLICVAAKQEDMGPGVMHTFIVELADEMWAMYQDKVQENKRRMTEGYDGKLEKCPQCDRELDVHEVKSDMQQEPLSVFLVCTEHGLVQKVK